MVDVPPSDPDDDLAALDFSAPDAEAVASDLDALGDYRAEPSIDDGSDDASGTTFTVTNPPGTVTVAAWMDGRVRRIELSPNATTMTEADLADEILVIARLATQEARASQYAEMLEGMREQGHDDVATRDFLKRDLDLPSPDEAIAARAQIFTTRYGGDE